VLFLLVSERTRGTAVRLTAENAFAGARRPLHLTFDEWRKPPFRHLTRHESLALLRAIESAATAAQRLADGAGDALGQRELERLVECGADAKSTLVEACLLDVWWAARQRVSFSRPCGMDFDDLVQEGVLGLLRALEAYDVEASYPFADFASMWIRASIGRASDRDRRRRRVERGPAPR
jgi:RNA polymerase primary sigma factor